MEIFTRIIIFLTRAAIFSVIAWITFVVGVEKKSLFAIFAGFFSGGAFGFIAGAIGFAIVGTVGWVAGAAYGAVGLFSFLIGGSLGGLALGGIVDVMINPGRYRYNFLVIIPGIILALYTFNKSDIFVGKIIKKGISKLNRGDKSSNSESKNF